MSFKGLCVSLGSEIQGRFVDVLLSSAPSFSHAAVTSLRSLDSLILVNFEFFLFAHLATHSSRAHLEEFGDLLIAGMRNHNGQMWLGGFQLDSRSVVLTEAPLDAIPSSDPQPVSALPAPPGWSAWSPWTKCDDHCIPGDKQERRRECRTNDVLLLIYPKAKILSPVKASIAGTKAEFCNHWQSSVIRCDLPQEGD
ncbi:unnamed protein product [Cyprideis torosa]|uniref:Uncharacterized protein n=1 Tax=Cyprideis torosa TaxID=163714 RepID=A0A7R8ZJC4_9CRUS|nr:unnamed protein product [Cyprideis torosa]CAG0886616.1 unnamed protein product [Cyprideis torosa]